MAGTRLVKVAKELNVGVSTIVEHLRSSGFEIESKPTAKVTDEMYEELRKEFHKSIAIKEKADQIVIGSTRGPAKEEEEKPKPSVFAKAAESVAKPAPVAEEKPAPEPEKPVAEEQTPETEPPVGLKVKGKIDLAAFDKKGRPQKKEEPKKEEPKTEAAKAPKQPEEPVSEKAAEQPETVSAPPESDTAPKDITEAIGTPPEDLPPDSPLIKAEAPQLKGLKILGKIELAKEKPKKKAGEGADDDEAGRKKRRRTRKKVPAKTPAPSTAAKKTKKKSKEEEPQVSQKEIEEKIKATMARITGGSKKKRQRLRRDNRDRMREKQEMVEMESETNELHLTEFVTVSELASLLNVPVTEIITTCMNLGIIVSINQRLDAEVIELVAGEFNYEVEFISAEDQVLEEEVEEEDAEEDLSHRPPVVTVMGHVDHGKTSLLDHIRNTRVVEGEAGGITQHIGAYVVAVGEDKRKITFIDTPGHEAFTAMRARGAKVTDIAIIIIAADDNVMPQTREAISHAQAAGVPIVFAINKVDKPGASPERIKQELASMNLLVEEWGGKYPSQDISALNGLGIDELLEKIALEADVLELKANHNRPAVATVLEASLDKGRGYVTKVLVQNGTLRIGAPIVSGEFSGRVKALFNEWGKKVKEAGPSVPVLVLGLDGAPQAGEKFKEMTSESDARQIASKRAQIAREQATRASRRISLDEIGRRLALGTFKELNLIVKGDFDGSVEALSDELIKLSIETIQVNVIHKAVGQIIESDVLLASASDAIIIGFQVRPSGSARRLAEREGVEIKTYSIIYEAIGEIRSAIEGMLEPTKEEKVVAQVNVREVYKISRIGTVAGCFVEEGKISRNTSIRLIRDGIVIYPTKEGSRGEIASLKRFKEDVREVKQGLECGLSIKNYNDIKAGDVVEGYEIIEVKQSLEDVR